LKFIIEFTLNSSIVSYRIENKKPSCC